MATVHRFVFTITLSLWAACTWSQQTTRILVSAYGAVANSHTDATGAFRRAIEACARVAHPVLVIPTGRYDLFTDSAIRKEYFISNTSSESECSSKVKTIGILFEGLRDLRVEGEGSLLVFHGKMTSIVIDHCDGFTMSYLSIDYARPTMSEFLIVRSSDTAVDVRVHPDSWYRLDSGRLVWYGENWTAGDNFCIRVDTSHAFYYAGDAYNRLTGSHISAAGDHRLHFSGVFDPADYPAGSVFTIRDPIRDEVGAFLVNSRNIRWNHVGMRYMHGLGIVGQFTDNISMHGISIAPALGSGRVIASFADGMHFSGCKGLIDIDSCRFDGLHDDAVNIHGTYLKIVGQPAPDQLILQYMHAQTYGFMGYYPGDSVAFVRPASLRSYGYAIVRSARMLSPREIEVTFKSNVQPPAGDVIENLTWTPGISIRHCTVSGTQTRGFLVTSPRHTLIADNSFYRLGMAAVSVGGDAMGWYESGAVHDLTIRNNTIRECGYNNLPASYGILIDTKKHDLILGAVHHNIAITGNRFFCFTSSVVSAQWVDGLRITGNRVTYLPYFNGQLRASKDAPLAYRVKDCSGVELRDNTSTQQ